MASGGSAGGNELRLDVIRGQSLEIDILVQRLEVGPGGQQETPLDLTGADVQWALYDCQGTILAEAAVGSGITLADQGVAPGLFTLTISPAWTDQPPAGYRHEAWVSLAGERGAAIIPSDFVIRPAAIAP